MPRAHAQINKRQTRAEQCVPPKKSPRRTFLQTRTKQKLPSPHPPRRTRATHVPRAHAPRNNDKRALNNAFPPQKKSSHHTFLQNAHETKTFLPTSHQDAHVSRTCCARTLQETNDKRALNNAFPKKTPTPHISPNAHKTKTSLPISTKTHTCPARAARARP